MKNSGWDIDKPYGDIAENLVDTLISKNRNLLVEVKHDRQMGDTGNLAIEFENNNGEPSGIEVTKSDWWFHVIGGEYFQDACIVAFKVPLLKHLVSSGKLPVGYSCEGAANWLLPLPKLFRRRK